MLVRWSEVGGAASGACWLGERDTIPHGGHALSEPDSPQTKHIVDAINTHRTGPITLNHRFAVGEGAGAYSITMDTGRAAVLKWWPVTPNTIRDSRLRVPRINRLRDLGWPIPPLLEAGSVPEALFELWDVAPGQAGVHQPISASTVSQAIALLNHAKGAALGDGLDWSEWLATSIRTAIQRAEPGASEPARDLLLSYRYALDAAEIAPGVDIIHGDFTSANCLLDGDRIMAVIDLDACRDGDGTIDLIGIAQELEGWDTADPEAIDHIWRHVFRDSAPDTVRVLLAYWVASTLAWATDTEWESHAVETCQKAWRRVA